MWCGWSGRRRWAASQLPHGMFIFFRETQRLSSEAPELWPPHLPRSGGSRLPSDNKKAWRRRGIRSRKDEQWCLEQLRPVGPKAGVCAASAGETLPCWALRGTCSRKNKAEPSGKAGAGSGERALSTEDMVLLLSSVFGQVTGHTGASRWWGRQGHGTWTDGRSRAGSSRWCHGGREGHFQPAAEPGCSMTGEGFQGWAEPNLSGLDRLQQCQQVHIWGSE